MKRLVPALVLSLGVLLPCLAWDNHSQISYLALGKEAWSTRQVTAEPLEDFLLLEKAGLAALLGKLEAAAIRDIPAYPPCPAALLLKADAPDEGIREAFFHALRINPAMPMPLYVQLQAGAPRDSRPDLPVPEANPYGNHVPNGPFKSLRAGQSVSALEVVATASDEPDYGMDIGLFEDNKSPVAGLYGFGKQAFGNPALPYGSQAPFHMALVHEDPLLRMAAPLTRVSLSDWRFRLYSGLSRYAFASGHDYWGWRFTGWALHYVQDMGQPWHASLFPGRPAWSILGLFVAGSQDDRDRALILLSNRHLLLEDYLYGAMEEWRSQDSASVLYEALQGKRAPKAVYRAGFLYDLVSWRAYREGRGINAALVATFPALYTSDPSYDYGVENTPARRSYDPWKALHSAQPEQALGFDKAVAPLFAAVGAESRAYVAWADLHSTVEPLRRRPFDLRGLAYLAGLALLVLGIVLLVLKKARHPRAGKR